MTIQIRRAARIVAGFMLLGGTQAEAVPVPVTDLAPNALIITEYLANPVGISDSDGEYFEIFNTLSEPIVLDGMIVRDDGSNAFSIGALTIGANQFAVLSNGDGSGLGFTPDYVYGGAMSLTNSDDEIVLARPDETLIHTAVYSDGDGFGAGIAHELGVVSAATPPVATGPADGTDFVAATSPLLMENFGSPGAAGNTNLELAVVPVPGAVWLFGPALGMLAMLRHRLVRSPLARAER